MSDYRDDMSALHARIESLEQELAEAKAKGEERGPESVQAKELAAAKRRIDELESQVRDAGVERAPTVEPKPAPRRRRRPDNTAVYVALALPVIVVGVFVLALSKQSTRAAATVAPVSTTDEKLDRIRKWSDCQSACTGQCVLGSPSDAGNPYALIGQTDCLTKCSAACGPAPPY